MIQGGWAAMNTNAYSEPVIWRKCPVPHHATWWSSDNTLMVRRQSIPAAVEATLEFGRFRVVLRQRQLLGGGRPIALGTRAFDLMLVLLEADGSLVTKGELLDRVWPGIVVSEDNLKVQVAALRRALGEDRDFIRTEIAAAIGSLPLFTRPSSRDTFVDATCGAGAGRIASCFRQQLVSDDWTVCAP
jgi:hypothetical protein